jgi:hypothetical protein
MEQHRMLASVRGLTGPGMVVMMMMMMMVPQLLQAHNQVPMQQQQRQQLHPWLGVPSNKWILSQQQLLLVVALQRYPVQVHQARRQALVAQQPHPRALMVIQRDNS